MLNLLERLDHGEVDQVILFRTCERLHAQGKKPQHTQKTSMTLSCEIREEKV